MTTTSSIKTLIIFDSYFGNTNQIAQSINSGIDAESTIIKHVDEVQPDDLIGVNLLIIGSPTRGFRPTEKISAFIKRTVPSDLKKMNTATFDTRIALETIKSKAFRWMVNTGGYAARAMARQLTGKKANLIAEPEGFFVTGEEGPLKDGETERAKQWGKQLYDICLKSPAN